MTVVNELINTFGKDNIFLVDADYHGLYEDDYCNFTYWNNVNGSMTTDYWTTAFACPSYGEYECMTLEDGINKGLVDMKKLLEYLKATSKMKSINISSMIVEHEFESFGLRIEAFKGRKWKGVGYWIGSRKTSYQWGVQLWKSDNGYGTTTTYYCKIYDPMTGCIQYVNINNCRLLDESLLKESYINKYNEALKRCRVEDIVIGSHGPRLKVNIESFKDFVEHETVKPKNINYAFDEFEYEQKKKASEFRTKKMSELVEWVKNNTDKKGDEILKLAEKIFIKKYA